MLLLLFVDFCVDVIVVIVFTYFLFRFYLLCLHFDEQV